MNEMLSPLQYGYARQYAQDAEQDQCTGKPNAGCNGGASHGATQNGEVQNDGVPCKMRRTVSWRNAFEHVIGVSAVGPCPGESADQCDGVELPDLMGECEQKWIERHAHYTQSRHFFVTEAMDNVSQLH